MRYSVLFAAAAASLLLASGAVQPAAASDKAVAGWVEDAWIGSPPIRIKAKLDTGADNSSINAPVYREFEKDGRRFVSFKLINNSGEERDIEKPVERVATVKRSGSASKERPVILLHVCVGGVTSEVEFTMADRSALNYPVLIGRSFLAGKLLVDSGRTFIAPSGCPAG